MFFTENIVPSESAHIIPHIMLKDRSQGEMWSFLLEADSEAITRTQKKLELRAPHFYNSFQGPGGGTPSSASMR